MPQRAQVFRKGGVTVEASNAHSDYFIKNKTAIRAEERLALAVYAPGAFGVVDTTPYRARAGVRRGFSRAQARRTPLGKESR